MKNIIFAFAIAINFTAYGQDSFTIADSVNFDITDYTDTLSLYFTEYPSTISIDTDLDGEYDITIKVNREQPAPNNDFTPKDYIYLDNHIGDNFEVLGSENDINFYWSNDIAEVNNDTTWISKETYPLFYRGPFTSWWEGIGWPGPNTINNVYLAFRQHQNDGTNYGWVKFSGTASLVELYLHEVAISKEKITTQAKEVENKLDINVFPNPTSDFVKIDLKDIEHQNLEWQLYDLSMQKISKGFLLDRITEIDFYAFNLQKGIYFLQISHKDVLLNTHQIIKI